MKSEWEREEKENGFHSFYPCVGFWKFEALVCGKGCVFAHCGDYREDVFRMSSYWPCPFLNTCLYTRNAILFNESHAFALLHSHETRRVGTCVHNGSSMLLGFCPPLHKQPFLCLGSHPMMSVHSNGVWGWIQSKPSDLFLCVGIWIRTSWRGR